MVAGGGFLSFFPSLKPSTYKIKYEKDRRISKNKGEPYAVQRLCTLNNFNKLCFKYSPSNPPNIFITLTGVCLLFLYHYYDKLPLGKQNILVYATKLFLATYQLPLIKHILTAVLIFSFRNKDMLAQSLLTINSQQERNMSAIE